MNFELKDIPTKLKPALDFFRRYVKFIFFISMILIAVFLVFRINQFSNQVPSEDAVAERLQSVQRPRIDESVIEKIQQLQDQNIEVQSLFDQARNNPFAE